jgi:hypothetical protein
VRAQAVVGNANYKEAWMKRHLTVLVASLALLLAAGVGTAHAGGPALGLPADQAQTIDQSQNATNSIEQSATAQSAAVNVSPNVAIGNKGSVDQSSDASSAAVAVNKNESQQDNELSNSAGQQSGALADDNASRCCGTTKHAPKSQSVTQSQDASNSISQNAESKSVAVNASPNAAVLNKGGDCKCGGGGVEQSSSASSGAVAVNKNRSTQSNTLRNDARQSQGGQGGEGRSQSIDQSQGASNSIDQNARAKSVAVNASPNVAIANSGPVKQDSNASSGAAAVNRNDSEQSNDLRNDAGQSQTGREHGCGRCKHGSAPRSQDARQSQNASNSVSQNAEAKSVAVNASPNIAAFNHGLVDQSSGASSEAVAVNKNHSTQSNSLGQSADQRQSGADDCCGCCEECNPCDECECEGRCED